MRILQQSHDNVMTITEINDRRHLQAFCFHRNRRILTVERGPYPVASKSRKDIERVTCLRFLPACAFCIIKRRLASK